MPIPIQQGRTLSQLVEKFGIKGRHLLQLDEIVVPTVLVGDLTNLDQQVGPSVYWETRVINGIAGEVGASFFTGSPGFDMKPLLVTVNVASGANDRFQVRLESGAVVPVLTGTATTRGVEISDPDGRAPTGVTSGTIPLAGIGGNEVWDQRHLANTTTPIDLAGWRLNASQRLWVNCVTVATTVVFNWVWSAEAAR